MWGFTVTRKHHAWKEPDGSRRVKESTLVGARRRRAQGGKKHIEVA